MKIRTKIALLFTLLVGLILVFIFGFIYYLSYQHTKNEFFDRLKERTNIVAQSHLEKDELSARIYDEIRLQHFQTLPDEFESVYRVNLENRELVSGPTRKDLPQSLFDDIFENHYAQLKTGETYHTGIFYPDNQGDFIVVASAKNLYGESKLSNLRNVMIIAFLAAILITYLIGIFYSGKIFDPIQAITNKAKEISVTNLHLRLETGKTGDELDMMATTFNGMLNRLETAFEIQTNFINNASHELKTPLTAILGITEVSLRKKRTGDEYVSTLETIDSEARRLEELLNGLLKLAQSGADGAGFVFEPVRIDEVLSDITARMALTNSRHQVALNYQSFPENSDDLLVSGNTGLLTVALSNIIDNACKFSNNDKVEILISPSASSVDISIKDKGVGIPKAEIQSISEPFFRASNVRNFSGYGVGLPLSSKIVALHKGSIQVDSEVGEGSTFRVSLPKTHLN